MYNVHTYMCIIHVCVHMYACVHICMYAYMSLCVYMHICSERSFLHTNIHTCIYVHPYLLKPSSRIVYVSFAFVSLLYTIAQSHGWMLAACIQMHSCCCWMLPICMCPVDPCTFTIQCLALSFTHACICLCTYICKMHL